MSVDSEIFFGKRIRYFHLMKRITTQQGVRDPTLYNFLNKNDLLQSITLKESVGT